MKESLVSDVLLHAQDMMMAIIEQRWDALAEMQQELDHMLRALFATTDVPFSEQEKNDLVEVQRLNQEIIMAVASHKADLATQLREIQQGKSKVGAYQAL